MRFTTAELSDRRVKLKRSTIDDGPTELPYFIWYVHTPIQEKKFVSLSHFAVKFYSISRLLLLRGSRFLVSFEI